MTDSENGMSIGWLFIVLLLFFGIFGGWGNGGVFGGGRNCNSGALAGVEINSLTDLIAMKGSCNSANAEDAKRLEREVLDLKCTTGTQSAVLTQQLETAFRTIISNQDAGFSNLRIQQLNDQLADRNAELARRDSQIAMLQSQMYSDARFNAIQAQLSAGFANIPVRPPFYPAGCTPCNTSTACCGSV